MTDTATAAQSKKLSPHMETAIVRRYLTSIREDRTGSALSREASRSTIRRRLADVERRIEQASPLDQLRLVQQKLNLQKSLGRSIDPPRALTEFVLVAASFSGRQGISWRAWRSVGVPAEVLRSAGIEP